MDRYSEGHLQACLEIRTLLQAAAQRRNAADLDRERDAWMAAIAIADKHGCRVVAPAQDDALKPGDVVQLKSGGPAMTIAAPASKAEWSSDESALRCDWFDGATRLSGLFAATSLRRVDAPTLSVQTSSEPDAWQTDEIIGGEYSFAGHGHMSESPEGFVPAGPWFPFAAVADPRADVEADSRVITVWRRALRKVAP